MYEGSQDFSGTWINESYWTTADETYNGLVVKYRKDAWNGIMKEIDVEKNGVYTFSFFGKKSVNGTTNVYLGGGVGATPSEASFNLTTEWQRFSITFSVANSGKVRARVENSNSDSNTYVCGYQLEENNIMTSYEPYVYSILKDKWYIEKNVLKLVVPNAVTGTLQNSNKRFYVNGTNLGSNNILRNTSSSQTYGLYCDILGEVTASQTWDGTQGISYDYNSSIGLGCMDFAINGLTTIAEYQNALKGKAIYAIANTPKYTLIENEELIEQLNRIYLQQGLNNISVNGNLPSTLKMTYVSDLIGIDEEQLKDINVNFGEKYGPINSLVIARAADSDFIYKEDEKSVAEDGLCEVKISDNQILNGDNRTQFIDEMYNQLRGTEFYLNDFSSTGITYLDLLDYFKVKVFDNSYKCLMLNDEINITQGLQEQVFTERPKESETEYKSIAKQDKDIRKIGIIVNKVEGEITAEIIARQDTDEKVSNLTQTIGEISTTVSTTTTQVNDLETRVQTNETSISQNSDSITATISRIQQTEDDVETLETNTEDVIKQLVFGDDGLTISAKGTTSDDMKLNLTNDAIKFLYQNNAVLTINGSTIEFSNASFKKLDLGNYVWQAEDDDSLSLIYEGD